MSKNNTTSGIPQIAGDLCGCWRDMTEEQQAAKYNIDTFNKFYFQLANIALTRFTWKGFPDSINHRFLETSLYTQGSAVVFEDEVMGLLGINCTLGGPINVYNEPMSYRGYGAGYTSRDLTPEDSVIIYNNYTRSPTFNVVQTYAQRLADIQRTIDVNVSAQKTPIVIEGTQDTELSLRVLFKKYMGNIPLIFGHRGRGLDLSNTKVLDLKPPQAFRELQMLKGQVFAEALTYLGIQANTSAKMERLVSDEMLATMGVVESMREQALKPRRESAEKINKMFGLNVSVEFSVDKYDPLPAIQEVEENGKLYNDDQGNMPSVDE